jgi:hypothetical protein
MAIPDDAKSPDAFTKTSASEIDSNTFGLDDDDLDGIAGGKNKGDYQFQPFEDNVREQ